MRWLALMLCSCDGLLGLVDVHEQDAAVDAPVLVTGRYVARVVSNDSFYVPTVTDEPFASIAATVRLADGTTPAVAWNADGTFSFSANGQAYALQLVANGFTVGYQLSTSQLDLPEPVWSRLDRMPVASPTPV